MSSGPNGGGSDNRAESLEVEELVAGYGGVTALHEVNVTAGAGAITAVLGANGAGKTTLLRAISGMIKPRRGRVLLLDEPSLGLAPKVMAQVMDLIVRLSQHDGLTIVLVEQNARSALQIATRGYVLETGRIVLQGTAEELLANRDVQRAYLGSELDADNGVGT